MTTRSDTTRPGNYQLSEHDKVHPSTTSRSLRLERTGKSLPARRGHQQSNECGNNRSKVGSYDCKRSLTLFGSDQEVPEVFRLLHTRLELGGRMESREQCAARNRGKHAQRRCQDVRSHVATPLRQSTPAGRKQRSHQTRENTNST